MKILPTTRLRQPVDPCFRHELRFMQTGDPADLLAAAACHITTGRLDTALSQLDDLVERTDLPTWLEQRIRTMRADVAARLQNLPGQG